MRSIRSPAPNTAGSLGPGHAVPLPPARAAERSKLNIESAEYANIVASVVRFYDSAIARGMRPLPAADEALLRRWMTRVLAGYWTHGGYLNWDTGFSFGRWHQMKKLALAQQALIGIAAGGRLSPSRAEASWAKHLLETGFELYERKLPDGDGVAPGLFYPLKPKPQSNKQALFAASRMAANAARAVAAGLPARPGAEPPALYSFDPGTSAAWPSRRRATTRRSPPSPTAPIRTAGSTSRGSTTAARRSPPRSARACPSSFGIVARNRHGRIRLATSRPASSRGGRPLRLLRAPSGVGSAGSTLRPFAGPFDVLRVTGRRAGGGVDARATYTFRRNSIIGEWTVRATTQPAPQRRGAVPEHGRRAGGRLGAAARRAGGADRPSGGP